MIPRVEMKALELMRGGMRLSTADLAKVAFCHEATARRVLGIIYSRRECRVVWWRRSGNAWVPVYGMGRRSNVPKPDPLTVNERVNRYLSNPEKRKKSVERKRAARQAAKEKRNEEVQSNASTENILLP